MYYNIQTEPFSPQHYSTWCLQNLITPLPPHTHTYHKLVDSQPVDLRPRLVNESDSDPPLDALLKKKGPHAPLVLRVVHRGRDVLPSWTQFTDLKVG